MCCGKGLIVRVNGKNRSRGQVPRRQVLCWSSGGEDDKLECSSESWLRGTARDVLNRCWLWTETRNHSASVVHGLFLSIYVTYSN